MKRFEDLVIGEKFACAFGMSLYLFQKKSLSSAVTLHAQTMKPMQFSMFSSTIVKFGRAAEVYGLEK
jgi:hypothetical protein